MTTESLPHIDGPVVDSAIVDGRRKPYKNLDSYETEDGQLFFGREAETRKVVATVLSRPVTLIHAPSGAGKTSLLNARVLPELERRGWFPISCRPHTNPIVSIRASTLQHALVPPDAELAALHRAVHALFGSEGSDATLDDLLRRFDELSPAAPERRELGGPIELPSTTHPTLFVEGMRVMPFMSRLLRATIEVKRFAEHLHALAAGDDLSRVELDEIGHDTPLRVLEAQLAEPRLVDAHRSLLRTLDVPVYSLVPFFENLFAILAPRYGRFSLVILLDQFEEVYTRFRNSASTQTDGASGMSGGQIRRELFDEILALYERSYFTMRDATEDEMQVQSAQELASGSPGTLDERRYPVPTSDRQILLRFVFSMRDEYIARFFDDASSFASSKDEVAFHLGFLTIEGASDAIKRPAEIFGYTYSPATYARIFEELPIDDHVEPAHLQIVCEKLWNVRGRQLSETMKLEGGASEHQSLPAIDEIELGPRGVRGILDSFFTEFLEQLEERERRETLELLEPLVTQSRTRNIVERKHLLNRPFRDVSFLEQLLVRLENQRIVRTEVRLGGYFIEITHEFLIDPVLRAIERFLMSDASYSRFRALESELEHYASKNFRVGTNNLLPKEDFAILNAYRDYLSWQPWTIELMLRCAVVFGAESITFWRTIYEESSLPPDANAILERSATLWSRQRRTLSLEEIWILNEMISDPPSLTPNQAECILRSMINEAGRDEQAELRFWAAYAAHVLRSSVIASDIGPPDHAT